MAGGLLYVIRVVIKIVIPLKCLVLTKTDNVDAMMDILILLVQLLQLWDMCFKMEPLVVVQILGY